MNDKNFITTLFMSVAGIIFLIIALFPIVFNIVKWIQNNNIKNNGVPITATIIWGSIIDNDRYYENGYGFSLSSLSRTYRIEYTVNDKEYSEYVELTEKSYKEGDTITMYCLLDNPNKIYIPLENKVRILSIFIVCPIFSMLGINCIKIYNIFTYKKSYN